VIRDAMELWTIKGVPIETRKRVIAAALQEGLTVGRWLERRANEWQDHQELRELVQMASDLSPKDGSLLRLARAMVRDRLKALKAAG
jgi:Arc/MetJ-type ribon-helix-helix transcriptional regulator